MEISSALVIALAGYLIGSLSGARVITKLAGAGVNLDDARRHQAKTGEAGIVSGIGASTVSSVLGLKYAGKVALYDILKAFIPVIILRMLLPGQRYDLVFSLFAIIGHIYPIYYRFDGGRGLSPMDGSLLVIEPIGMTTALLAATLLGVLINQPHTALVLWIPMLASWSWFVRGDIPALIYTFLLLVLFLLAEIPEMRLAMQYRRQGRMDEYTQMILTSTLQMRMMKRLAQRLRFRDKEPFSTGEKRQ
ncbi:MAG TPA: glycerol-3-phosphate acyltransferase [Anaerolineales bacterium]|nr:glycerol-3-phosphate acyltransferase [Anaerolineales bacterium]